MIDLAQVFPLRGLHDLTRLLVGLVDAPPLLAVLGLQVVLQLRLLGLDCLVLEIQVLSDRGLRELARKLWGAACLRPEEGLTRLGVDVLGVRRRQQD